MLTAITGPGVRPVLTVAVLLGATLAATAGWLPLVNLALLVLFAGLLATLYNPRMPLTLHLPLWFVTVVIGFAAAIYRPEGFHYPLIRDFGVLHEGGTPFKLFANISKAVGGLLIILWLWERITPDNLP